MYIRKKPQWHVIFLLPILLLVTTAVWAQDTGRFEYSSRHMGTTFRIILYADSKALADSAAAAAFARVESLNDILSDYKPDSELNRLVRTAGKDTAVRVSNHLFRVLDHARTVSEKTGGAFDVTVGPYVTLWRAMNRQPDPSLPSRDSLKKVGERVGYRHLKLNHADQTVTLATGDMQLDLGGIAKGYAVDQALNVLRQHGIEAALVDGGGDISLGDPPPSRRGWRVEVLTHDRSGVREQLMLELSNKAVATSGDLFQHVMISGVRYSHIIDPRTGLGLTDRRQVTVIAPDGITADSYASAASVLRPEKALELVSRMPSVVLFMEQNREDGIRRWQSPGFERLLVPRK
ncbi:MAG: FAD:protein FMN transferase [Balneolaceae bacterium]|nr:FAD:protein FMN transferase [Balneolaceae bacterium]